MTNSAAAPIWAGMVGQVNAALIAQNKPPMGFMNPWLYGAGLSAMNDVTTGASVGCNGKSGFGQPLPPELGAKVLRTLFIFFLPRYTRSTPRNEWNVADNVNRSCQTRVGQQLPVGMQ